MWHYYHGIAACAAPATSRDPPALPLSAWRAAPFINVAGQYLGTTGGTVCIDCDAGQYMQVAYRWQTSGMQVACRWHASGMQAACRWHAGGMQVACKWHAGG